MNDYRDDIFIRPIDPGETMILTDFLYEAIYQPDGLPKISRTVLQDSMIWAYIKNFGKYPDDLCFVAVSDRVIVGAAWSRIGCSYGKVDEKTPELAMSVYPEYRRKGIGSRLLSTLLDNLASNGYHQVSLSVDKANFAVHLYRKLGFETIEEREHDYAQKIIPDMNVIGSNGSLRKDGIRRLLLFAIHCHCPLSASTLKKRNERKSSSLCRKKV